jgi:hypothetical protein
MGDADRPGPVQGALHAQPCGPLAQQAEGQQRRAGEDLDPAVVRLGGASLVFGSEISSARPTSPAFAQLTPTPNSWPGSGYAASRPASAASSGAS